MSEFDREDILRIAKLAHLSLTDAEVDPMMRELNAIVGYVRQLQEVPIEDVAPTTHVLLDALPLRADEPRASLDREQVLSAAPVTRDGSFAVAAFVDEG